MKQIVFATQNAGKVKEIKAIFKAYNIDVLTMKEAGIDLDIEENGTTFEANAIIKAEALTKYTDALVLADDSGLEIDFLNKEPGVYSARYLGKDTPYEEKNQIILKRLEGAKEGERSARFVCVIAAAQKGKQTVTTTGVVEGYIGDEAKGENGFGYDPIFYVPEYNQSTAELSPEIKNQMSHRAKALKAIKPYVLEVLEADDETTYSK